MLLEQRMEAIGEKIRTLASRLGECGFRFRSPEEVLPGPEPGTMEAIARIEREAGELPLALKLFWERIGSVNFCGSHPDWEGAEYPDPLFVFPPSVAIDELDQFLSDREERLRHSFPYLVPIAPDDYHKEDVSGGMWYNVSVPAVADDPQLHDEWHNTTFVGYLVIAILWAGFPGLARYPGHNWPIEELARGL
jgi:hypothetical protein